MVGSFAFTSSARKLLKVGNFGKFLFPRKLGIAQACFALFQNRSPTSFDSISACIYPSSNLYSTLPPGGIVKSSYTVEIPDFSLNDYVLSKFNEYGDDLAMVSLVFRLLKLFVMTDRAMYIHSCELILFHVSKSLR